MSFPFETMTAQEVFDTVAKHLLTQNRRSCLFDEKCAYRGTGGLMCAAGCLIPDDQYDESMEGAGWLDLDLSDVHRELIASLQYVHDYLDVDRWKKELSHVAENNNLEFKFDNFVPGEQT